VLYLSQVCLQLLGKVSGSGAHKVCSFVSITILDLLVYTTREKIYLVLLPFSTKLCDFEQKNSLSNPLMAKADLETLLNFFLTLEN
jgi:hypothetical protein